MPVSCKLVISPQRKTVAFKQVVRAVCYPGFFFKVTNHKLSQSHLRITLNFDDAYCPLFDSACVVRALELAVFETVSCFQSAAAPQRPHVKQALPLPVTLC